MSGAAQAEARAAAPGRGGGRSWPGSWRSPRRRAACAADRCVRAQRRAAAAGSPSAVALGPTGTGQLVGATEYGGPGDPSSGIRRLGDQPLGLPDSYAELGGTTFQTATAMGGLPYLTPLRITWGDARRSHTSETSVSAAGPSTACRGSSTSGGSWPGGSGSPTRTAVVRPGADRAPARRARGQPLGRATRLAGPPGRTAPPGSRGPARPKPRGRADDRRRARSAALERTGRRPGRRAGRGRGDHRRRQPDRRQAVPGRRRPRGPAVGDSPAYDCSSSVEHLLYGGGCCR